MNKQLLFDKFPHLESAELSLKKVGPEDAEDLFAILSNEKLFRYRPGNPWKTLNAVKNVVGHYQRDFNQHKMIFLGIYYKTANDRLVGIAEMFDFDGKADSAEIGYTLNEDYWGKGIATQATALMLDYLFNVIGVNRVQAAYMPVNVKSGNVLKRNGFVYEGTLRQCRNWTGKGLVDLAVHSVLKEEYGKVLM